MNLVVQNHEEIARLYKIELRNKFRSDETVRSAIEETRDLIGCKDSISALLSGCVRPGTEDTFDLVLTELLQEVIELRKNPSALIVNQTTGEAVMRAPPDAVYTPPDFIGEDGKPHKAKPILHPKYTGPLTLLAQHKAKEQQALERTKNAPPAATAHLRGNEAIIHTAKELLECHGINTEFFDGGITKTIEIGREQVDGILQSPNYMFHRAQLYGNLLARKIINTVQLSKDARCVIESVVLNTNSKQRWYSVSFRYLT